MKTCRDLSLLTGLATSLLAAFPATAQLTPAQINDFKDTIGNRVEATTILGGDYGVGGSAYRSSGGNDNNANINITKFGGSGVIGAPQPLGTLGIGWQPILQGNMGYLTAKNNFYGGPLDGDTSEFKTFAIQFGGGARFWFNDNFSIAPTFMGMYGHTENDYTAKSAFGQANQAAASRLGLINWSVDTWTVPRTSREIARDSQRPRLPIPVDLSTHRRVGRDLNRPTRAGEPVGRGPDPDVGTPRAPHGARARDVGARHEGSTKGNGPEGNESSGPLVLRLRQHRVEVRLGADLVPSGYGTPEQSNPQAVASDRSRARARHADGTISRPRSFARSTGHDVGSPTRQPIVARCEQRAASSLVAEMGGTGGGGAGRRLHDAPTAEIAPIMSRIAGRTRR